MPKQMRNFKTGSVEAHPISLKLPPRCQKFFVLGFEMTDLIFLENEIIQVRPTWRTVALKKIWRHLLLKNETLIDACKKHLKCLSLK